MRPAPVQQRHGTGGSVGNWLLYVCGSQDRTQEAGEALFQFRAERDIAVRPLGARPGDACLAQPFHVMAEGRLGDLSGEVGLDVFVPVGEHACDSQPDRIRQRVQDGGQADLLCRAMIQRSHA